MGLFDFLSSTKRPPSGTPVLSREQVLGKLMALNRLWVLTTVLVLVAACDGTGSGPTPNPPSSTSTYSAYLPDPNLTPGDTLDVTTDDICVPGYSQKVRDVPESVKKQAYAEYGITSHEPGAYEVDHLISLELGGSNALKNLWPESYTGDCNAHVKDKLENHLHKLVCDGSVDLKTAQHEIATDWVAAYQKYIAAADLPTLASP